MAMIQQKTKYFKRKMVKYPSYKGPQLYTENFSKVHGPVC